MLKENAVMISLIIFIFIFGLGMKFFSMTDPAESVLSASLQSTSSNKDADFQEQGTLVEQNGRWILVYQEEDTLGLTAILDFADQTKCDFGQGKRACREEDFTTGMRVRVDGSYSDNYLTVNNLVKLD